MPTSNNFLKLRSIGLLPWICTDGAPFSTGIPSREDGRIIFPERGRRSHHQSAPTRFGLELSAHFLSVASVGRRCGGGATAFQIPPPRIPGSPDVDDGIGPVIVPHPFRGEEIPGDSRVRHGLVRPVKTHHAAGVRISAPVGLPLDDSLAMGHILGES